MTTDRRLRALEVVAEAGRVVAEAGLDRGTLAALTDDELAEVVVETRRMVEELNEMEKNR